MQRLLSFAWSPDVDEGGPGASFQRFHEKALETVNRHLADGWAIVPGTLSVNGIRRLKSQGENVWMQSDGTTTSVIFAVLLEQQT